MCNRDQEVEASLRLSLSLACWVHMSLVSFPRRASQKSSPFNTLSLSLSLSLPPPSRPRLSKKLRHIKSLSLSRPARLSAKQTRESPVYMLDIYRGRHCPEGFVTSYGLPRPASSSVGYAAVSTSIHPPPCVRYCCCYCLVDSPTSLGLERPLSLAWHSVQQPTAH